jgi:hypothetical protein
MPARPLKRRPILLRLAQAWILALIAGSLQPARPAPVRGLHSAIHWLAFAGTTSLLLLLCRNRREEIRAVAATCLMGLSLEYLQHVIYRNAMEWRDVRDDTLAVLAALTLYHLAGVCKAALLPTRSAASPES